MLGLIIASQLIIQWALSPEWQDWVYTHLSFIPAAWTGGVNLPFWTYLITPISFNFLHGGWLHLIMNAVMFLAFGAGIEKMLGAKRMLILFFLGSICGLLGHFIFYINSPHPLVGASGGLSAMFGAILYIYYKRGMMGQGKYGIWPIVLFWIGISVLFGLMGPPDGSGHIAWIAHITGFLGGMALVKPIVNLKI